MPTSRPTAVRALGSLALALLIALPSAAAAQVGIGVAGGPVVPLGDLGDRLESGFHGGVVLDVALPLFPVGFRGDLFYQRLPGAGSQESYDHLSVTANARLTLLPLPLLSGYVTAGAGLYSSDYDADLPEPLGARRTHVGLNGGVGARVTVVLVRGFVEARYHRVLTDPARAFLPITVGIAF